jgi:hypothetical protein
MLYRTDVKGSKEKPTTLYKLPDYFGPLGPPEEKIYILVEPPPESDSTASSACGTVAETMFVPTLYLPTIILSLISASFLCLLQPIDPSGGLKTSTVW